MNRQDYLAALLTALAVFCVYALLVPSYITGEDAGELAAAAYTLGIPHPPGYPLWCLIAHAFTWIPYSTMAWRVGLCSAFFGAATVFVLVLLGKRLSGSRTGGVVAGLAVASAPHFLWQSLVPEVYTLNAFLLALCWLLLCIWQERRDERLLWAFAAVYGLGLANHNTMHLLGPVFGLCILWVERAPVRRLPAYAGMACLAFTIAFLLYCYLPIRSLANPPVDWGNPETLANWWRHVTRGQYAFMVTQEPRTLARMGGQLAQATIQWGSWWGTILSFIGGACLLVLAYARPASRKVLSLIVLSGIATTLGFLLIQNPDSTREWMWVMRVFSLPMGMATALGLSAVALLPDSRWRGAVVLILALGLVDSLLRFSSPSNVPDLYARRTLEILPPDAIVVPHADHQSFPLQYLQVCEGLRPDVFIARKYGYVDVTALADTTAVYGEFPARRHEPEIFARLLAATDRPVYFFKPPRLAGVTLESCWVMERALRPGEILQHECNDKMETVLHAADADARTDYTAAAIYFELRCREAEEFFEAGLNGKDALDLGLHRYGRDATSLYNAGAICARHGFYTEAREYFDEALIFDARHAPSLEALRRLDARES